MTETWRAALWMVWSALALIQGLYYGSDWCRQRWQLREAEEQAELQRRMSVPVPEGTSGPWKWCSAGGWVSVMPQVPSAPATGGRTSRRYCPAALSILKLDSHGEHLEHLWWCTERSPRKQYRCWGIPVKLPKAPKGPAPGAVCDAYALGCQCWQCVARAERDRMCFVEELGTGYPEIDRALGDGPWAVPYAETPEPDERTFCERYDDPGLMDHEL